MNEASRIKAAGSAEARSAYYREAASWSADVQGTLRASRRLAWTVAGALGVVAVLEALALAALAPLKSVVPYTILVDRQTGYVETVRGLQPGPMSQSAAVTQSFLVQYVLARETFDATDLTQAYRKVMLWSAGEARGQYQRAMSRTDPQSPLRLYPPTTQVAVTIKSVSLITPTTALVRFDTVRRDAGAGVAEQRSWASVMAFRYSGAPMRMEDRFINPLGFQVTSYRRDAETTTPVPVLPAAPPVVAAPVIGASSLSAPVIGSRP